MSLSAARLETPLSPLTRLLLGAAQPGYERSVLDIGERWSAMLPPVFQGVSIAEVTPCVLDAAEQPSTPDELRLQVVADLGRLRWWCGLETSDDAYVRIGRLVRRVFAGLLAQIQPPPTRPQVQPRSHALFVGALLGPTHSPSRGAIDYARSLVDDPAVERVHIYHRGPVGPDLIGYIHEHLGAFHDRIGFFQDQGGSHLPDAIGRGPYVHHVWCEDVLALEISVMSLFGPTVMFTCGDEPPMQYADVYWYLHEPDYIATCWARRGVPEAFIRNYAETSCSPNRVSAPVAVQDRAALGLRDDQVVLATVGNRLAIDFDQPFVDGMADLLRRRREVCWLVVGALPPHLLETFRAAFGAQFLHVPFERRLRRLLTVADLFVNPFRRGGGDSAILALLGQAVVLARGDMGDVRAFIPTAHRGAVTSESFFAALEQLVADPDHRRNWREAQAARIAEVVDEPRFTRTAAELSALAFARYQARPSCSLPLWADC
jgi:hypothetical protein